MQAGEKFGRLTAIKQTRSYYWIFKCECGKEKEIRANMVSWSKGVRSCGCLQKEAARKLFTTHGMSQEGNGTYKSWRKMRDRVFNKNHKAYHSYGGRGIEISESWKFFDNFYRDMGERPWGKSLDRIDVNGNYCKENCKWSTKIEQQNNRRDNHYIEINGEKKTLTEWSRIYDIKVGTINWRIRRGWTEQDAITTSIQKH